MTNYDSYSQKLKQDISQQKKCLGYFKPLR